jgi:hypothetical protein
MKYENRFNGLLVSAESLCSTDLETVKTVAEI